MTIRKSIWVLRGFICLAAGVIACWAGRCEAYEPWEGQVTVRLNVRQAPGRTSPVITQIDQGALVTVSDEREGWYKVTIEGETFGFIGWVHGKYVKDPNALSKVSSSPEIQKKPESQASPPATRAAAPAAPKKRLPKEYPDVAVKPKAGSEKEGSTGVKASPGMGKRGVATESRTETAEPRSPGPIHEEPGKEAGTDRPEIGKVAGGNQARPDALSVARDPQGVRQQHVSTPASPSGAEARHDEAPPENKARPPVNKLDMSFKKGDSPLATPPAKASAETKRSEPYQSNGDSGWGVVMGVVIKLVVVAFSCLALIFAYRVWQVTRMRDKD